jgi:hypothetical protein
MFQNTSIVHNTANLNYNSTKFLEDWSMLKVQAIQQTLHQQKEDLGAKMNKQLFSFSNKAGCSSMLTNQAMLPTLHGDFVMLANSNANLVIITCSSV